MVVQLNNKSSLSCDPTDARRCCGSGPGGVKWATGHVPAGNQAVHGAWATGRGAIGGDSVGLGTWNVRALLSPDKLNIVKQELDRYKISFAGLAETHWRGSGHFLSDGHYVYFSGNENKSRNGVAIVIPAKLNHSVLGFKTVSDTIITMKIDAKTITLNVI